MSEIQQLVDEVVDFFLSPQLLSLSSRSEPSDFHCAERTVGIRVCSAEQYVNDINTENNDSFCEDLDERMLATMETWAYMFQEFSLDTELQVARDKQDKVGEMLGSHNAIRLLAEEVASQTDAFPFDEIHNHVAGRVGVLCEQICAARVLTGGRRYGLTEALFKAFTDGLLPFGYDASSGSIVCLRPSAVSSPA